VISALTHKAVFPPRNSEAAIRTICRAVIRRVRDEHPHSSGYELFLHLWAAYPFASDDDLMQQVFHEEVLQAVGRDADDIELVVEPDAYVYAASAFIQ
jgi:hypothetical protein